VARCLALGGAARRRGVILEHRLGGVVAARGRRRGRGMHRRRELPFGVTGGGRGVALIEAARFAGGRGITVRSLLAWRTRWLATMAGVARPLITLEFVVRRTRRRGQQQRVVALNQL